MGVIHNDHPGYTVYTSETGESYPIHLDGGAMTLSEDDKGRSLSNVWKQWSDDVAGNPFKNRDGSLVWFNNEPHAHNFLNKWIREQIGLDYAERRWDDYLAAQPVKQEGEPLEGREQISFMGHYLVEAGTIMELWARGKVGDQEAVKSLHDLADEAVRDHLYTTADLLYKNSDKIARKVA